ncbi:MAG: EAL domain-containing protein [Lysobacter sp.]|nr:MAG: EAL domain-containing protein [Lysobacter sp.]
MKPLYGLQARFIAVISLAMIVVVAVVAVMWQRQNTMQTEVLRLNQDAMRTLVQERLRDRGEAQATQAAELLANPLYYFDLDAIGDTTRSILHQPGVSYVLVYDGNGDIIHDGSGDIPSYGQAMRDPLAARIVKADDMQVLAHGDALDVSMPIMLGDQRLGGVRIGYSLSTIRVEEAHIGEQMARMLGEIGNRYLTWIALLLLSLLGLFIVVGIVLQRALVRPIRQLSAAAREIESGNFATQLPAAGRADEVGTLIDAFSRMSDSIVRHDRDMRRMAYTDALTGLSNRLAFREALDHRLMELRGVGRQLALLFADIDDFKRVNDTLGHDVGDEVLVQCANRIREAVDRLAGGAAQLARFGGDEFVILLHADAEHTGDVRAAATQLAEHLVAELGRPILAQDRQVFLGTSIGVTLFPDDASGATMLMKNGDIAMYQAKLAGKNCYRFYSRAMDQAVSRRVRIEQDLRGAWERGELTLVYQPVYRLSDKRLVGAEALLRWKHPIHGQVAPSVFIDVAEQSGLIESIGPAVVRAACKDAAQWRAYFSESDGLFVAINVSARQLRSGDFREQVLDALRDSGLPPQSMHIELTETAVLSDEGLARTLLSDLRNHGIKVWLDDFGTGFSGLSHLRRVPVDGVKIDRSFIADVLRDPDDLALTAAIIAMAHSLGMTVVAEGVEKEGQTDLLRSRECDLAQGYWFGHPMPMQDFCRLLG